jgi:hypothetical protein
VEDGDITAPARDGGYILYDKDGNVLEEAD